MVRKCGEVEWGRVMVKCECIGSWHCVFRYSCRLVHSKLIFINVNLYNCSCNCICCGCGCDCDCVCCVLYCLCSIVCCVLFESGVLFCVMCVICVLCLILVPLPPGKPPFAVNTNNNNNNLNCLNRKYLCIRVSTDFCNLTGTYCIIVLPFIHKQSLLQTLPPLATNFNILLRDRIWLQTGLELTTGFIGLFNTSRDYALQFKITHTNVHSHVFSAVLR
jgi:hypothetical protein